MPGGITEAAPAREDRDFGFDFGLCGHIQRAVLQVLNARSAHTQQILNGAYGCDFVRTKGRPESALKKKRLLLTSNIRGRREGANLIFCGFVNVSCVKLMGPNAALPPSKRFHWSRLSVGRVHVPIASFRSPCIDVPIPPEARLSTPHVFSVGGRIECITLPTPPSMSASSLLTGARSSAFNGPSAILSSIVYGHPAQIQLFLSRTRSTFRST